jgi:pimeloyl-ACP methyl ester carboxylesterase
MVQNFRIKAATSMDKEEYEQLNSLILFSPDFVMEYLTEAKTSSRESPGQQVDVSEIVGRINAILDFDARPLLSRIRSKTLVMAARDDILMPPRYAKSIMQEIGDASYREFDAGGHMFPITQAECFADEVLSFLGDQDPRATK